jgi:hypothetical protein
VSKVEKESEKEVVKRRVEIRSVSEKGGCERRVEVRVKKEKTKCVKKRVKEMVKRERG